MSCYVGFVGYECEDIVLYLAECSYAYGKRVAIEDRTEHGMLLQMLEQEQRISATEQEESLEYHGIFVSAAPVSKEKFDVIFLVFGYRLQHPKLYECETLIMITDDLPAHAALLRKVGMWERKQVLLLRNHIGTKYGIAYLEFLSKQKYEREYCIPWEERDIRARNSIGMDTEPKLYLLSEGMKFVLRDLLRFVFPEIPEEFLKRVGRKGRRGMEYWES